MLKKVAVESAAEAYLELLAARGVEYFFANAGTDFAPLIEAYAKRQAEGKTLPRPLTVPHEVVAVAMAHGYAMVTGRPQVVMVHVIVGTANALGGIINAARSNVPMLMTAGRNPITEAGASGSRDRQIHWAQESFDPAAMVRVFEQAPTHMNFPQNHPLHAGFDPGPALGDTDLILVVECDAPWYPALRGPRADTKVIQVGVDPLFSRYPIRGFPGDVALAGSPRLTLAALADAVRPLLDASLVRERRARWEAEHERLMKTWADTARKASTAPEIEMPWLSRCIGNVVDDRTIVVNEYDLDATQVCMTRPGSYFNSPASSALGWGLGAALGAKLAKPDHTVICCVGDGSYIFGVPIAAHFVARAQELPVLFVVFNNRTWNAVKRSVLSYAKDGWAVKAGTMPLTALEPSPDYEMVAQACGGYGERVDDPAKLPEAIARALRVVREEKRHALLNVI